MRIRLIDGEDFSLYDKVLPGGLNREAGLLFAAADDEAEGEPVVGVLEMSSAFGDVYTIEYIFIKEDYRKKGLGYSLITYATHTVRVMGAEMMTTTFMKEKETEPLLKFFKAQGFSASARATITRVKSGVIKENLERHRKKVPNVQMFPLKMVKGNLWEQCKRDCYFSLSLDDAIVSIGGTREYNRKISYVAFDEAGKCVSMILFAPGDEELSVSYLWSNDPTGRILSAMLLRVADEVEDDDRDVVFNACTPASVRLATSVIGKGDCREDEVITMVFRL